MSIISLRLNKFSLKRILQGGLIGGIVFLSLVLIQPNKLFFIIFPTLHFSFILIIIFIHGFFIGAFITLIILVIKITNSTIKKIN